MAPAQAGGRRQRCFALPFRLSPWENAEVSNLPQIRYEVVIAGGGFAGVYCAQSLARELGTGSLARVAIIADQNFMVFQPMLAEVVGSSVSPRHVINPIRRLCRGVTVLRGSIAAINLAEKCLTLNAGVFTPNVTVAFDHLVLALGGIVDLSRVPGMPEHAFLMKNVGDALELRSTIIDRFEEANLQSDRETVQRLLRFVVVGGGYSGVETAGQILDLVQDVSRFYSRISREDPQVILIHSSAHLLPEISEKLGLYAEKNMRQRGVEIILNTRVTAMTSSKVHLEDGRTIETHTTVSTVGNAPHPLILDLCKKHNIPNVKGRMVTEPTMRVPGHEGMWAAGDCAAVPLDRGEQTCPPTAQFAYRQGKLLGQNIAQCLAGAPLEPFSFTGLGELAAIGHRSAVADIYGVQFSGFVAWFLWRTIYLLKLPGLERKLRVMIDWTLDLFFPKDITLLRSRPTEVVQEVHLEKGDHIFHAGEPAFSFYIVKAGRIDLLDENGIVKSLSAGEHFGERALLQDKIWRFDAVAMEPTTLVSISGKTFETIARASSSIQLLLQKSANQYLTRREIEALVSAVPEEIKALRVDDLMSHTVATLQADWSIAEALAHIAQQGYNSYPILDGDEKPVSLLNQNDIYDALKGGLVTTASSLREVPVSRFSTVLPETTIPAAMERFCRSGSGKLLVVDEQNRLRGILTPIDLLGARPVQKV